MLNSTASIQTYTHIHTVITILWPLITWSCTAGDICAVPLSWPAVILSFQNVYNFPAHRHCWQGGALSTLPAPQLMMPPWPSSKQRRFLHSPLTARKQKRNYKHKDWILQKICSFIFWSCWVMPSCIIIAASQFTYFYCTPDVYTSLMMGKYIMKYVVKQYNSFWTPWNLR